MRLAAPRTCAQRPKTVATNQGRRFAPFNLEEHENKQQEARRLSSNDQPGLSGSKSEEERRPQPAPFAVLFFRRLRSPDFPARKARFRRFAGPALPKLTRLP